MTLSISTFFLCVSLFSSRLFLLYSLLFSSSVCFFSSLIWKIMTLTKSWSEAVCVTSTPPGVRHVSCNIECINNMSDIFCQHCGRILNAVLNQPDWKYHICHSSRALWEMSAHMGVQEAMWQRPERERERFNMNTEGQKNMLCIWIPLTLYACFSS